MHPGGHAASTDGARPWKEGPGQQGAEQAGLRHSCGHQGPSVGTAKQPAGHGLPDLGMSLGVLEPDGLGWSPRSSLKKELGSGQVAAALLSSLKQVALSSGPLQQEAQPDCISSSLFLFCLLLKEAAKDSRLVDRAGGRAESEDSSPQPWQDQRWKHPGAGEGCSQPVLTGTIFTSEPPAQQVTRGSAESQAVAGLSVLWCLTPVLPSATPSAGLPRRAWGAMPSPASFLGLRMPH